MVPKKPKAGRYIVYWARGADRTVYQAAADAWLSAASPNGWQVFSHYVCEGDGDWSWLGAAVGHAKGTNSQLVVVSVGPLAQDDAFRDVVGVAGLRWVSAELVAIKQRAKRDSAMVSERTKAGLAAAKARGVKLGGKRISTRADAGVANPAKARAAAIKKADAFAASLRPILSEMQGRGLSLRGMAAELAGRGIKTQRGGAWTAAGVRNLLAR